MAGTETIWDSSCYKLLRLVEFANTDTAQKMHYWVDTDNQSDYRCITISLYDIKGYHLSYCKLTRAESN